jgi:hypothetical protein
MLYDYLRRGLTAGALAGLALGGYVALVGNPLVERLDDAGHAHGVVAAATTNFASVAAGVLWGVLLGVVAFGVAYYFLEPALPGGVVARSYLLGAAGFVTVSGAPWLVLPPRPPGVEGPLGPDASLALYAGAMLAGALACALAGAAYRRLRPRGRVVATSAAGVPLAALLAGAALAPVPGRPVAVDAFLLVVVGGQAGLWCVLAGANAWLFRRDGGARADATQPPTAD